MAKRTNRDFTPKKVSALLSEIRVETVADFKGGEVLLLTLDRTGLKAFLSVLKDVDSQPSELIFAEWTHEFQLENEGAEVKIEHKRVRWLFSRDKFDEVIEKLRSMQDTDVPCHHYVDIDSPASVLMLSCDEYSVPAREDASDS